MVRTWHLRWQWFVVLVIGVAVVAAACGGDDDDDEAPTVAPAPAPAEAAPQAAAEPEPAAPVSTEPYKLYVVYPLTGPVAVVGTPAIAGVQAYIDFVNDEGGVNGRQIELIIRDDQTDPPNGIRFYREAAEDEDVIAMLLGSVFAITYKELSNELELPCICLPGDENLHVPTAKWLFNSEASAAEFHPLLMEYAAARGFTTAAYLRVDGAYDESWTAVWEREAGKFGLEIVARETLNLITAGATDATVQLTKLRDSGADFIHVFVPAPFIWAQIKQLEIGQPIFTDHPGADRPIVEIVGDDIVGATALIPKGIIPDLALDPASEHYRQAKIFLEEWEKRKGNTVAPDNPASTFVLFGWNVAQEAVEGLRRGADENGNVTRASFRDAIESINGDFTTAMGVINFGPDDHSGIQRSDFTVVEHLPGGEYKVVLESALADGPIPDPAPVGTALN